MKNATLKKRILEISYKHGLSHLGSNLTAVDIIEEIYSKKKKDEPFILSSGHAALALFCVIEKNGGKNAEQIFLHHGVHPDRCKDCGLDCSTGSLGHGLGIAVGMALADRTQTVWSLISDGECAEGSTWEALEMANKYKLKNLKVYINYNGWGAYRKIDYFELYPKLFWNDYDGNYEVYPHVDITLIDTSSKRKLPFLKGQSAHYYTMSKEDYQLAKNACR